MKAVLIVLTVLFIILNILDVYTTRRALKQGGYEANPFVRFLMRYSLFIPVKVAVVVVVIILMVASDLETAVLTGLFCCFIYLCIVGINCKTLRRLNRKARPDPPPKQRIPQKNSSFD